MTPLNDAATLVSSAHEALMAWVRDTLASAGLGDVAVVAGLGTESHALRLAVVPTVVGPWPKTVETTAPINLLGAGPEDGGGVPEHWRRFGRALTVAIENVYPMLEGPGRARIHPQPPLESLPTPLAAWYRDQAAAGAAAWVLNLDGRLAARLPSLSWRPALTLRVNYAMIATREAEIDVGKALSVLGALSLRLSLNRVLRLRQPAPSTDPALLRLAQSLADLVGEPNRAELRALIETLQGPADHMLGLLPGTSPTGEDFYELMRTLRLPLQPALTLALHLPLGAGPEFGPGTTPNIPPMRESSGGSR